MKINLTAADIRWPGADKDRAADAAWHLYRAATWLAGLDETFGHHVSRNGALIFASEHARMARGCLGAIGFEQGARL